MNRQLSNISRARSLAQHSRSAIVARLLSKRRAHSSTAWRNALLSKAKLLSKKKHQLCWGWLLRQKEREDGSNVRLLRQKYAQWANISNFVHTWRSLRRLREWNKEAKIQNEIIYARIMLERIRAKNVIPYLKPLITVLFSIFNQCSGLNSIWWTR